jgi:hypothetical protein
MNLHLTIFSLLGPGICFVLLTLVANYFSTFWMLSCITIAGRFLKRLHTRNPLDSSKIFLRSLLLKYMDILSAFRKQEVALLMH